MSKEEEVVGDEFEAIVKNLPKKKSLMTDFHLYYYQGFWVPDFAFRGVISAQKNFAARDDDIILTACPKSGLTWLKALVYSITNRTHFALSDSPLLKANPHDLVPFVEFQTLNKEVVSQRRLLSTHMLYDTLPPSIITCGCKIVSVCRNPMDQFISYWHYACNIYGDNEKPHHLEECFDIFCRGIHAYGPFWDHVLGYWKASLERPDKILFLKYEEMKKDTAFHIKRLAGFLGFPFSEEEIRQGVVEEISTLCSLRQLKDLDVNKNGSWGFGVSNRKYFRKGEVGDWKNFLTPSMVERMEKLMKEKFEEYDLTFELSL